MKHRAKTFLCGLAGLSLLTSWPLSASVAIAQSVDQGIPLVCRPPEAGETPNAYIPTSQNVGTAAQGRMLSPQATARQGVNPPANVPARLPASPKPASDATPTTALNTGVAASPMASSTANAANQPMNQPMNQLSREVQTGSQYRICPPPTMPSTLPSTQLYAVPFAVAAAWECYGPREMAYTPRPWRGPDPAVHSPLPIKPTRAATSQKAKPQAAVNTAKPEAAVAGTLSGTQAPAAPAVGHLPAPTVGANGATGAVSASGNPPQIGSATGNRQNGNVSNAGYRPVVTGSGSVAAPLISTTAPTAPPQIQSQTSPNGLSALPQGTGQNMTQNVGQPYSGGAPSVAPSRDIVDTGEAGATGSSGARVAQAPVSLLDAPPLTPNPTPNPSGFTSR